MKRIALAVCLLLAGCVAPRQETCPRCKVIDSRIREAEAFMPGYWVEYQTRDLEPTGDPHTEEYHRHRRWIEARDALTRAEGKVQDE